MVTTKEAAERLGVSMARVRQLIQQGQVQAWRKGKSWEIDEGSLERYAQTVTLGRPTKARSIEKELLRTQDYTLMSRNHEVAYCSYSKVEKRFVTLQILDEKRVPLALVGYQAKNNELGAFNEWWGNRAVPHSRSHMSMYLGTINACSTFELPLRSMGLSLSDQYWLRPAQSNISWSDITFFFRSFDMGESKEDELGLPLDCMWLKAVGLSSPDNTTDGMLSKRWMIDGSGRRVLVKGSTRSGREPVNEVIATMLYRRLLPSSRYVEYRLARWRGEMVSVCETFLRDDEEFVSAWYVCHMRKKSNNHNLYRHYCEIAEDLGARYVENQLARMLVCDSILANTDRHMGNFGLVRNVETLEWRVAPIFDSGTSLWPHVSGFQQNVLFEDHRFTAKPFFENPQRQLNMVPDATWYHPEALVGFVEEVREYLIGLSWNPEVIGFICKGLEKRINVVNYWARKAPTKSLSPEYAEQTETLDWIWLP